MKLIYGTSIAALAIGVSNANTPLQQALIEDDSTQSDANSIPVAPENDAFVDSIVNSDDILQMIAASCHGDAGCENLVQSLSSPEGFSLEAGQSLRRLKQLKALILWLQPEHRFARYCFYGCWCLPDADHKLNSAGYGKPVDDIDASCKRQSQCYDCAQMDNDNVVCDASSTNYKYRLHYDVSDPTNHWKKSIECLDVRKEGERGNGKSGCKRSVCECDKKLAEDLRQYFDQWNVKKHAIQGGFDWNGECEKVNCSGPNCGHELACCGNLGFGIRMPYRVDGRRNCCGTATYDSTFYECCDGDVVQATGTC